MNIFLRTVYICLLILLNCIISCLHFKNLHSNIFLCIFFIFQNCAGHPLGDMPCSNPPMTTLTTGGGGSGGSTDSSVGGVGSSSGGSGGSGGGGGGRLAVKQHETFKKSDTNVVKKNMPNGVLIEKSSSMKTGGNSVESVPSRRVYVWNKKIT